MILYNMLIDITMLIAVITNLISMFMIKRENLVLFQLVCNVFFTLNFLFQSISNQTIDHEFDALPCFLIVILCSYILMRKSEKTDHMDEIISKKKNIVEKGNTDEIVTIIFIIFMIILIQTKWDISAVNNNYFPLMASILVVYALMNKNIRIMKIYYLFVGLLWILYDINEGHDISNTYNQILLIISIIGSFLLYDVLKMEDKMQKYFLSSQNYLKNIHNKLWK